jgi:hypothetical protein
MVCCLIPVIAVNKNVNCEIQQRRNGTVQWEPISVQDALGLDRFEPKRCPECHGPVRIHNAGRTASSPVHFEHRPAHAGCSQSFTFKAQEDKVSPPQPSRIKEVDWSSSFVDMKRSQPFLARSRRFFFPALSQYSRSRCDFEQSTQQNLWRTRTLAKSLPQRLFEQDATLRLIPK